MSADNPFLVHLARPAYELPRLLTSIHHIFNHISYNEPLTKDEILKCEAAKAHAANSQNTIAHGIESIGQLLYLAGNSEDGLDPRHLCRIGELVTDLGVQMQHLHDVESDIVYVIARDLERSAKKGGAK